MENRDAWSKTRPNWVYGVLAVSWPYPLITAPAPELLWGVVNLGMEAGILAWLAIHVARPRWLALIGGGMAILGHLIRIARRLSPGRSSSR